MQTNRLNVNRGENKMVEMKVDASELKGDESKLVEKLADFLKEKTGGDVTKDGCVKGCS